MPRCPPCGAAAFIDGTERTFLERYSDYSGRILVLSGLGIHRRLLRHYWKRNERETTHCIATSLLDLISKARQAETAEELATMQGRRTASCEKRSTATMMARSRKAICRDRSGA